MEHRHQRVTTADGTQLAVERWMPDREARFAAIVLHGGGEHVGRYGHLAERWAARGGIVFGPDLRGFGNSEGPRGHVMRFGQYADDLRRVVSATIGELSPAQQPSAIPYFLFGHSMGGLVALVTLLDGEPLPLRGAVISSPLLGLAMKVNPLKLALGRVMARVRPRLTLPSNIPLEKLTRDPEEVARYRADPRRTDVVTTGWFAAMNLARNHVKANIGRLRLPLLWYRGTADQICDAQAMADVFAQLDDPKRDDQTFRTFDGYYHELHREPLPLREPVLAMIDAWIEDRL